MVAIAKTLKMGDGLEDGMELGPVQNAAQFEIVKELAQAAKKEGGRILCGGNVMDRPGYFFEPVLL